MWPNLGSPDVHDHDILSGAVHMCIKSENKGFQINFKNGLTLKTFEDR